MLRDPYGYRIVHRYTRFGKLLLVRVDLTEPEVVLARRVAILCHRDKLKRRCYRESVSPEGSVEANNAGTGGELANAKYLDTVWDTKIRPGGDNGIDVVHFNYGIQCKCQLWPNSEPDLYFTSLEELRDTIDLITLSTMLKRDQIGIYGFIEREEFLRRQRECPTKRDYGHGERFYLPATELRPAWELWELPWREGERRAFGG
jgi:hypothetical protein